MVSSARYPLLSLLSLTILEAVVFLAAIPAQAQDFIWVRQFGTSRDDQANAVAASPSGVYVGGNTIGVFPNNSSVGLNDVDAFVARYDNAGVRIWVRQFGSSTINSDSVNGVAADSTGVYAVGSTNGVLPGLSSTGSSDVFVRKYDVNGIELWTRQFGTPQEDDGLAAAVDATGVYVVGNLFGDAFVRKYDLNGNELWHRLISTTSVENARGVAVDSSGVYVVGNTNGELAAPAVGGTDIFLRKFDVSGNVIWTRQFGTSTTDEGTAVAVNSTGVYVAGNTTGTFAGEAKAGGLWDEFAARFDLNGTQQWVDQFGTSREDAAYGVALTAAGAYFVGYSDAAALPGTTALGGADAWVRVYNASGSVVSTRQFGTNSNDEAYGVAADVSGVYIAGYTSGTFPGQTSSQQSDAFVARIPPPPDVSVGGVVNNASFLPHPAPLAPGSIAAVFGSNLNDGSSVLASSFGDNGRLVTTLGGASATINGTPAPIFYSTLGQIGIQIPFEVAGQTTAQIVVTVAGQSSVPRTINLDTAAPGIFTANQQGSGIAALLHQDGVTAVTVENPARPNEVIVLFATGLGVLTPALATGAPSVGNTAAAATVTVDGTPAVVDFSGAAPGFVGLNQINFRIPPNARTASNLPLVLTVGGKQSNAATIPVGP